MTKRRSKSNKQPTKIIQGCLGIIVLIVIIALITPKKQSDSETLPTAASLADVAVQATSTEAPQVPSRVTIIPTVVIRSGFVTITPAPGTVYPTATITDTPIPPTDAPTDVPASATPGGEITAIGEVMYDVVSTANARSCASSQCDLIGKMQGGQTIYVTAIVMGENYKGSPAWMQTTFHDGQTVYVHSSLVRPHVDRPPTQEPILVQATSAPIIVSVPHNCATARAMGLDQYQAAQANPNLDRDGDHKACYDDN